MFLNKIYLIFNNIIDLRFRLKWGIKSVGLKDIKFIMTIFLLLSWCVGCSNSVPLQTAIEDKIANPTTPINDDLEPETNQEDSNERNAYLSILSGNFELINEDDCKSEMEYLYKESFQNGKCEWKYILMDFNKDGSDELFIQLNPDYDSALFCYKDGNIQSIGIDDTGRNSFMQPLKGGKSLVTSYYRADLTKIISEYDSEFEQINRKQYYSITVDDYEYFKEQFGDIINQHPIITKEGVYYFQEIEGKETNLSKEEWERIQKDIDEQIISDSEWKDCSQLVHKKY